MTTLSHYPDAVRLLERERELDVLREAVHQARSGPGVGVALAGDSGTGKSATVAAVLREVTGLRVLRGQCDPLGTPRPLGPFRELGLSALAALLGGEEVRPSEAAEAVLRALGTEPTVLVVEDLHWTDAASADVLRYLVRRVETVPVAVLLTYRDREVGARHPARPLLGDFATLDGLRTLALRPLSVEAVAEVVEGAGLDAARVHALTGGNPFYVSQVALEPDRPLPASVRDTVLARTAEVEPEDLEALQLVASAPDELDDRLLPLVGVDLEQLQRLDATTLLRRTPRGVAFRHELARQAVETTIPPGGAPRLHQRLLDALEQVEPRDPAVLTHHAVAARDAGRTLTYARAAAAEAVAAASNTEAASFLELALAHLPSTATAEERAGLLTTLAQQLYVTARFTEAGASARAAIPLWQEVGDLAGVAEAHALLCVLEYQSARTVVSRRHSALAWDSAADLPPSPAVARVYADTGMVALVTSALDRATECGRRAAAAAGAVGLEEYVVAGRMLQEGVRCITGEPGGRDQVQELTTTARRHGWDELAWRGYCMLFIHDMDRGELRDLQRVAEDGLLHTTERDMANAGLWQLALRASCHAYAGRWSAAREDAGRVLEGSEIAGSVWPHVALATVGVRLRDEDVEAHLDAAWRSAVGLDDPGRTLGVFHVLAEAVWVLDRPDPRVHEQALARLPELLGRPDCAWPAALLALWLRRLGLPVDVGVDLPAPYAAQLAGRTEEAAQWWRRTGNPFAEAMAYADSQVPEHRLRAVTLLDRLGAVGTADRLRRELRRDGLAGVPQRPVESTRANPGGLTNRQLEVARLVARGFTNSEIAAQAFISPKTAEHHVAAVLMKLGLANRRELVTGAAALGLD